MSILGDDTGSGFGVKGTSPTGSGVAGDGPVWAGVTASSVTGSGVSAFSDSGAGVLSLSNTGPGVSGTSQTSSGVTGTSNSGAGVVGLSTSGLGIRGESQFDNGILGTADANGKAGVFGRSTASNGGNGIVGLAEGLGGIGVFGSGEKRGTGVVGVGATGIVGRGDVGPGLDASSKQQDGVRGQAEQPGRSGVLGQNSQTGPGVTGNSAAGTGVEGTGVIGVLGTSSKPAGPGVVGRAGAGPWPTLQGATIGQSSEPGVPGVDGTATADFSQGLRGTATGGFSAGVMGVGMVGVTGVSTGTGFTAPGVQGMGHGTTGFGVVGISTGTGSGVLGTCSNGVGVTGLTDGSGGTGIFGYSPHPKNVGSQSFAAMFHGAVNVTGPVHKSGGGFRIDHPDHPETHYLQHWFVESDEMRNLYDGIAVLDGKGSAEITLPAWFETLNEAVRYQLTPLGHPAPDLHIARECSAGSFVIGGGHPGQRVSWQVTGVRRDRWAVAHRLPADLPKAEGEQGLYRHPELYDLPEDRGVDRHLTQIGQAGQLPRTADKA